MDFEEEVCKRARYVRSSSQNEFLEAVAATSAKRVKTINTGFILYRAQIGCEFHKDLEGTEFETEHFGALAASRMVPLTDRAREGRVNAKGIPVLYAATDANTAIAEVRPWVGAYVTVGRFALLKTLRLVNCVSRYRGFPFSREHVLDEPPSPKQERSVWFTIDLAFSTPMDPSDDVATYAATQTVAELFRAHGFDGIIYRSSLGRGRNFALFSRGAAELRENQLYRICSIAYSAKAAPVDHLWMGDPDPRPVVRW